MNRKAKFEDHMNYYFPTLSLKPGKLNDYNNKYTQIAWFFYEQGVDDGKYESDTFKEAVQESDQRGWEIELPRNSELENTPSVGFTAITPEEFKSRLRKLWEGTKNE